MDFQTFITQNEAKLSITADIEERWQKRIVKGGLYGTNGVADYMALYAKAKNIKHEKLFKMGMVCKRYGRTDMAMAFWIEAYRLKTGSYPIQTEALVEEAKISVYKDVSAATTITNAFAMIDLSEQIILDFPEQYQPGKLAPMQPHDTKQSRDYFITNPKYQGQPKRDGEKLIVFGSPDRVYYQARSMTINSAPSEDFENAIKAVVRSFGSFILEGEYFWLDAEGKEHQNGALAKERNDQIGSNAMPTPVFSPFHCLAMAGKTWARQEDRVMAGQVLAEALSEYNPSLFRVMPTARTEEEKRALVSRQQAEGREGEIWFDVDAEYVSGKSKQDNIVRTKYLTDPIEYLVTEVLAGKAAGHAIAGFRVSLNGVDMGKVGTGYNRDQQVEILERFNSGKPLKVKVVSQGFTVYGKLKLGRFKGFVED